MATDYRAIYLFGTFICGFATTMFIMPRFIAFLRRKTVEQPVSFYIKNIGDHDLKQKTPIMGGVVVLFSSIVSFLLFLLFHGGKISGDVALIIGAGAYYGTIGLLDDLKKLATKQHFGLSVRSRVIAEIFGALVITFAANALHNHPEYSGSITLFTHNFPVGNLLGTLYFLLRAFVVIASVNAVNISDGLDGLVSLPLIICFASLGFLSFMIGTNPEGFRAYAHLENAQQIGYLCLAICGSLLGFLWFNANPAKIFMGDTGSLSLGGLLGAIAIIIKAEFLLVLLGIVLVIETTSCVLQIAYYKATKKRLFLMAPIHHHFEKIGFKETTIVTRMWIISIMGASFALITLL